MVDVLPTIAGLAGIAYRNHALGRDLLRQQAIDGGQAGQRSEGVGLSSSWLTRTGQSQVRHG